MASNVYLKKRFITRTMHNYIRSIPEHLTIANTVQ
uniref:Uncharacterized protein n=1 Tax=Anguilla anguilla TaxID=7936 RepID=A0A0E9Q2N1_ANGAN